MIKKKKNSQYVTKEICQPEWMEHDKKHQESGNNQLCFGFVSKYRGNSYCCIAKHYPVWDGFRFWVHRLPSLHINITRYGVRACSNMVQLRCGNGWVIPVLVFCEVKLPTHIIFATAMMTSSNGNIFRVTGHLCGEITGPRWIPRTKASDAELWCFLWSASE